MSDLGDKIGRADLVQREVIFQRYRTLLEADYKLHDASGKPREEIIRREILDTGFAVSVLPYDPIDDTVVLLRQYRVATQISNGLGDMIEVAAGMVDTGEEIEVAARRECLEETGLEIKTLVPMFNFMTSPGITTELMHLFLGIVRAENVAKHQGLEDEGEFIETMVVPADEAIAALDAGRLNNVSAVACLSWLARFKDKVRAEYS